MWYFITYLFKLLVDDLGFLMALEPHHKLSVEPPALLFKGLGCQVLCLGPLHIVKDEEESLRRQSLEKLHCIRMWQWNLLYIIPVSLSTKWLRNILNPDVNMINIMAFNSSSSKQQQQTLTILYYFSFSTQIFILTPWSPVLL